MTAMLDKDSLKGFSQITVFSLLKKIWHSVFSNEDLLSNLNASAATFLLSPMVLYLWIVSYFRVYDHLGVDSWK